MSDVSKTPKDSVLRVNCELLQQEHSVGNLIGSAKGYVGYSDEVLLSQNNVDKYQKNKEAPLIVLWDEIDKAANSILNILLGIFDTGRVTLSSGVEIDLRNSIQICTCNLAARELARALTDSGLGFHSEDHERKATDDELWRISKEAVRKHMRPELIGRFTKIITFHSLSGNNLKTILDIELAIIQKRLFDSKHPVLLKLTLDAKHYLLKNGTSEEYGARNLRKLIEKKLVVPLASIVGSGCVHDGDTVIVGLDHDKLSFSCDPTNLPIKPKPALPPAPEPAPTPAEPCCDLDFPEFKLP